ncbi:hypothetical protein N7466_002131 [Penicillium verhagenii]|uniref:uncharacterized protein n=1 Tax=Penicillium verhagenii TaxID=1562060 RepID=UPI002545AADB|nr:uncharacterized protein N7466_002131 [Penicillium verhagenii]KAJ5938997.1 hypothetical protein N7466_002131 [Penicillium verhagenii]
MPTMTNLERASTPSTSLSMSPRLSDRELTPGSELSLLYVNERVNQLDSRILELRSNLMTKNGYVEARNREDDHIRREFANQSAVSQRIDLNIVAIRKDIGRLEDRFDKLQSDSTISRINISHLQSDVGKLQSDGAAMRADISKLQSDSAATRIDISKLQYDGAAMRADINAINIRMDLAERIRFNSIVCTIYAPIRPVPIVVNGALEFPQYFPRSIWRFWCLKKRSRVHRLIELAEFYQLEGYQEWRHTRTDMFAKDDYSSDSSDNDYNITRAEAVQLYPEAAHQALAASLGLIYYKIRNEVGEGHNAVARPPKRQREIASASTSTRSKPVKMPRRPSGSDTFLQQLISGVIEPHAEAESSVSEHSAVLGWKAFSDVSEDAKNKLLSMDPNDLNAVFRAMEQGRLQLQTTRSERLNRSPTESKAGSVSRKAAGSVRSEVAAEPGAARAPAPIAAPILSEIPTEVATPTPPGATRAPAYIPAPSLLERSLISTEVATPAPQSGSNRQTTHDVQRPATSSSDSDSSTGSDSSAP